jgi:hypothetical protein
VTKDELTALRDGLTAVLAMPDSVRALLASWLIPSDAPSPSNGQDWLPPPAVVRKSMSAPTPSALRPSPAPSAKQIEIVEQARQAEDQLLRVLHLNPGVGVLALSRLAQTSSSTVKARLHRLSARGLVEKGGDKGGGWRVVETAGDVVAGTAGEPEAHPPVPP